MLVPGAKRARPQTDGVVRNCAVETHMLLSTKPVSPIHLIKKQKTKEIASSLKKKLVTHVDDKNCLSQIHVRNRERSCLRSLILIMVTIKTFIL